MRTRCAGSCGCEMNVFQGTQSRRAEQASGVAFVRESCSGVEAPEEAPAEQFKFKFKFQVSDLLNSYM